MIYMDNIYVTYHTPAWADLVLRGYCTWTVDDDNVALMKKTIW
jgi:hypothetical protein